MCAASYPSFATQSNAADASQLGGIRDGTEKEE